MVASELLGAACFLLMAAFTSFPVELLILRVVASLAAAPLMSATAAALPGVVGSRGQLPAANAKLAAAGISGGLVGPLIAAVLILISGPASVFLFNTVTFLISAVLLIAIDADFRPNRADGEKGRLAEFAAGFRYLGKHQLLRPVTLAYGIIFVGVGLTAPAEVSLSADFGVGSTGFAALCCLFALGGIAGTRFASRDLLRMTEGPTAILAAASGAFAVGFLMIGFAPGFHACPCRDGVCRRGLRHLDGRSRKPRAEGDPGRYSELRLRRERSRVPGRSFGRDYWGRRTHRCVWRGRHLPNRRGGINPCLRVPGDGRRNHREDFPQGRSAGAGVSGFPSPAGLSSLGLADRQIATREGCEAGDRLNGSPNSPRWRDGMIVFRRDQQSCRWRLRMPAATTSAGSRRRQVHSATAGALSGEAPSSWTEGASRGGRRLELNHVLLTGILAADPQPEKSRDGDPVTLLLVAFSALESEDGEDGWIPASCEVEVPHEIAEPHSRDLRAGAAVLIAGRLTGGGGIVAIHLESAPPDDDSQ